MHCRISVATKNRMNAVVVDLIDTKLYTSANMAASAPL